MTRAGSGPAAPFIERLAERLIPPAAAEHVLGDLAESSPTPRAYARGLFSVLPWVVLSQVRRRATIGGIIFNIVFSGFFILLFQRIPKEPFLDTPAGWLATLGVLAVWVAGGTLAVAYGPKDRPAAWSSPIFFATFVATIATAAILGVPALRVAAALGTIFGIGLLLSMPMAWQKTPPPLALNTIDDHARLFQKAIRWRNGREAAAAVFVLSMNIKDLFTVQDPVKWTGHLLLVAATLFIVGYLYTRARSRRLPSGADAHTLVQFHRGEIVRQRDILRSVPLWYLMPFVPGAVLIAFSHEGRSPLATIATLAAFAAIMGVVWGLNVAGARFLDKQLKEVAALETRS